MIFFLHFLSVHLLTEPLFQPHIFVSWYSCYTLEWYQYAISSIESQTGLITIQWWSIENQKGTTAVHTKSMVIVPFWFSTEHLWTVLMPVWFSADNMLFCWLFLIRCHYLNIVFICSTRFFALYNQQSNAWTTITRLSSHHPVRAPFHKGLQLIASFLNTQFAIELQLISCCTINRNPLWNRGPGIRTTPHQDNSPPDRCWSQCRPPNISNKKFLKRLRLCEGAKRPSPRERRDRAGGLPR